ncbi:MAG: hypothetical protein VB070_14940 [Clostridiaceae bacterium]|nr:hypothetical protein [Clostridiaceae bacterium]
MTKCTPYPFYWDNAPVDISFVFKSEKPAGKHGFLQAKGDAFIFEDGTPGRFWGTNFNSGMDFPEFDYSEKTAKRLAKIGINVVRFHQLDSEWATPNIFQYTKGERKGTTRSLDPESMDHLDYLIFCLKNEGIYCYIDMMTYRKFKSGDGIENAIALGDSAKPYSIFSRKLIDLQKEFIHDIWHHINPYTGLAYKDDPVFILSEITNECDLFNKHFKFNVEPYHTELIGLLKKWLAEQNLSYDVDSVDFSSDDEIMIQFKMHVQESYYQEIYDYMRDLGVKIPITGTNWSINAANAKTQLVTDFNDSHAYWYGWRWQEFKKEFDNRPMVAQKDTMLSGLSFNRSPDRPFFVSEWDAPWPNDWRAESSLIMAAAGSFQGWAGFTIHTYMYSSRRDQQIIGRELTAQSISNVPYRQGVFATWNDPAKFGLFYHAALIMRRGDVRQAEKSIAVAVDELTRTPGNTPAFSLVTEQNKIGIVLDGKPHGADQVITDDLCVVNDAEGAVRSDTGELYRSWKKRIGSIDTAMTKCVYGFLGEAGTIGLTDLSVKVDNEFAVVALSSLTDTSINNSDNLLLTTVGHAENTDMKFNEQRTEVLDLGKPPILVEVIEADIAIKTSRSNLRVWSISPEGFLTGIIPSEYQDGTLKFHLGNTCHSIYYLIQAE